MIIERKSEKKRRVIFSSLSIFIIKFIDDSQNQTRKVYDIRIVNRANANVEISTSVLHTNASREPTHSNNSCVQMVSEIRGVKRYIINDVINLK